MIVQAYFALNGRVERPDFSESRYSAHCCNIAFRSFSLAARLCRMRRLLGFAGGKQVAAR